MDAPHDTEKCQRINIPFIHICSVSDRKNVCKWPYTFRATLLEGADDAAAMQGEFGG